MDQELGSLRRRERLAQGFSRKSLVAFGLLVAIAATVGYHWSDLLDANGQMDWLLAWIWFWLAALVCWDVRPSHDGWLVLVGLAGGAVIESWGTQTGLWRYFTDERPPLWILPAWPVAALAIDRQSPDVVVVGGHAGNLRRGVRRGHGNVRGPVVNGNTSIIPVRARSRLPEDGIDDPASAGVRLGRAAVVLHEWVIAPGVLERIAEDGHQAELALLVDVAGEVADRGREPLGLPFQRHEGIRE